VKIRPTWSPWSPSFCFGAIGFNHRDQKWFGKAAKMFTKSPNIDRPYLEQNRVN
jgi:hypothetical protein